MADLDEEFARFAAELKSVEQAVAAETAAADDAAAAPPPLAPPPVLPPPVAQVRHKMLRVSLNVLPPRWPCMLYSVLVVLLLGTSHTLL
jgi:hypothetical protein